jgi:hypothetical protein
MKPHENLSLNDMPNEKWRQIDGYNGKYFISSVGRIKAITFYKGEPRMMYIKKLSQRTKTENEYIFTGLSANNTKKSEIIHRLVAKYFIPNPDKKPFVNHKNGVKWDNRVENLEWVTGSENTLHAVRNGLRITAKGEDAGQSLFTNAQVLEIFNSQLSIPELCKIHKVHDTTIRSIKDGRNWSHLTGVKYKKKGRPYQYKLITIDGVSKTYTEWASQWGSNGNLIFYRLKSGWSERDAVTIPPNKTGCNKKLNFFRKIS